MFKKELFKKTKLALEAQTGRGRDSMTPVVPDDVWRQCPSCKKLFPMVELAENHFLCPKCQHHFRMTARQRIAALSDTQSFEEWEAELGATDPLGFDGYEEKLRSAMRQSGEREAVVVGKCTIHQLPVALMAMESGFMMGSMGSACGEKITRLFERATAERLPVVAYTVSGGARMQEGILSLMQMAKTSAAVKRHHDAGLLYIAILTDPTTGGVTASFAMEGDITLAEPGALIAFAGPRVIEQTIHRKLPSGFQRAEFLLEKGFVDMVAPRKEHRWIVSQLLQLYQAGTAEGWAEAARQCGGDAEAALEGAEAAPVHCGGEAQTGLSGGHAEAAQKYGQAGGYAEAAQADGLAGGNADATQTDGLAGGYADAAQSGGNAQAAQASGLPGGYADAAQAGGQAGKYAEASEAIGQTDNCAEAAHAIGQAGGHIDSQAEATQAGYVSTHAYTAALTMPEGSGQSPPTSGDATQADRMESSGDPMPAPSDSPPAPSPEAPPAIDPAQRVRAARDPRRPSASRFIESMLTDFIPLAGDRAFGEDGAVIGGVARLHGQSVTVIAIEKGLTTQERLQRNFGSAHPEGYRKALRLMRQAEKFGLPVICLVDTAGAYCGIGAEERGQGYAIARNLMEMSALRVPVISVILGEGGSGGALALAVADEVWMMENAVYSVISPEGCASILWKDASRVEDAARALKLTAQDLKALGVIERVIEEDAAYLDDPLPVFAALRGHLARAFARLAALSADDMIQNRYARFRSLGGEKAP